MTDSKKRNQPSVSRFHISLENYPKTVKERENMRKVPYALVVGRLIMTDNTNTKETRNHKRTKHIYQKYHIIRDVIIEGIVDVVKVVFEDNLAVPFTKTLLARSFKKHMKTMAIKNMAHLLH
ncbi:hypothetical protein J1N35_010978 [Gossypium stocksii]|uniref:Uncharacterized protein n=1 Tax=Gossypium stocksii TaxID=47602 RepID=A0A9D3W377_9ROSI|nr:hypothetical protein J1N35_010978 [Gossypium stocksii]